MREQAAVVLKRKISDTGAGSAALTAWQTSHRRPCTEETWATDHMALTESLQSWVLQADMINGISTLFDTLQVLSLFDALQACRCFPQCWIHCRERVKVA